MRYIERELCTVDQAMPFAAERLLATWTVVLWLCAQPRQRIGRRPCGSCGWGYDTPW